MLPKQFIIIAYDICNDRRRQKIARLLEGYGQRVNYSVFECMLTTKQLRELKLDLLKLVDPGKDNVLMVPLCKNCIPRRETIGVEFKPENTVVVL